MKESVFSVLEGVRMDYTVAVFLSIVVVLFFFFKQKTAYEI